MEKKGCDQAENGASMKEERDQEGEMKAAKQDKNGSLASMEKIVDSGPRYGVCKFLFW